MLRTRPRRHGAAALLWALVWIAIVATGLYFGYIRPEITAIVILLTLVGVWVVGERLTGKWWY